jgi:hypothetical protein
MKNVNSHPAMADLFKDFVVREDFSDHRLAFNTEIPSKRIPKREEFLYHEYILSPIEVI